jgi:K319-like protein
MDTSPASTRGRARRRSWRWTRLSTRSVALLGAALAAVGLLSATSNAVQLNTQTSFLSKVGPVTTSDGFPTYYQDSTGLRLAHCFDGSALCGGAESPLPDPTAPVSFPNNYPFESFYFLAQATVDLAGGGRGKFVATLEASFNSADPQAGAQMTFSRIRFVVDAPTAGTYTIIHPYGKDTFDVATPGPHSIFETGDVGIASGVFTGALGGRIDPFLEWDTGPVTDPQGNEFVGDPNTDHAVVGSPYGTNFFEIDGPNVGGTGINSVSTNLFSLVGRIDTNAGLDPGHPTYSRTTTDGGFVDVHATSDSAKSIKAQLPGGTATTLRGAADGSYVARLPYTGATPPTTVTVSNLSDKPQVVTHPKVTDLVTVTDATYDSDNQTLSVSAVSSDQALPPAMSVPGFGALSPGTQTLSPAIPNVGDVATPALTGAVNVSTQTFTDVAAPPETIDVTSAAGGTVAARVRDIGSAFAADPTSADAGADQTVQQGQQVTLDGSASINADTFAWTQTAGPAVTLTGADSAVATFTAPVTATTLTFRLTASTGSASSTDDITITVAPVAAPVANAGPDQTGVLVGNTVLLNATGSTGAATFAWTQVSGAHADLTGADTARASFTMPAGSTPMVFQVRVTGPGGTATDQVTITAQPDTLAITRSEFGVSQAQWRIDGTASILDNNIITVFLGNGTTGTVIGSAQVSPVDGTFDVRVRGSNVSPTGFSTVTVQSSRGGLLTNVPFTQK